MTQKMQDWLAGFAAEIGISPPTSEELDLLLELAGVAAQGGALRLWVARVLAVPGR